MAIAEHTEVTRRGFLSRAGAGAAGAAALSIGGPSAVLAAPARQAKAPNTLYLNKGSEPDSIDPQKASFIHEIDVIMRVFRNLLTWDGENKLTPDQAESMPTIEENGTLYTFTLKPNITFSDGVPVTAQHFVDGWRRHMDPRTEGQYAFLGYIIQGGEALNQADPKKVAPEQLQAMREGLGVRALDERTLQIKTVAPAPWFLSVLTTWCGVPVRLEKIMEGNGGEEFGSKWTEPATYIGNGPYVLTEWDHSNRMHMKANQRYYLGAPPIGDIEFFMIAEAAVAFAAYLNDELDFTGVVAENKGQVDSDPQLRQDFYQYAEPLTIWIAFNSSKAPFDNQKVRLAFTHAFDRVGYVRNIEGGQGIPARQLIPPGFPGYYEYELEEQVYNPDIARRLLAEAGYPGGRGLPEIKLAHASTAVQKRRAEAYAEQFKQALGINLVLDPIESRTLVAMRKKVDTFPQMTRAGWHQDYADPQNWYSTVFNSKKPVDQTGWSNKEFDRLTDEADVEVDPVRRLELYRQAAQIFINDAPVILSHWAVVWGLKKPRVVGFQPDPMAFFLGERSLYDLRLRS